MRIEDAYEHAPAINGLFQRFPNYKYNAAELRHLKAELYKLLLPIVGKDGMIPIAGKLLKLSRK